MSFNRASFTLISRLAGNALWYYRTKDNLCSNQPGSIFSGYFRNLWTYNKTIVPGDMIYFMVANNYQSASAGALNILGVGTDADDNSCSYTPCHFKTT